MMTEKNRKQIPVRTLFCILFLLLMLGGIGLNFLLSSLLLEEYYISDRKKALVHDYGILQTASVQDLLETDDFDLSLRSSLRKDNVSLLVMDSETRTVKVWSADTRLMEERLYANLFGLTPVIHEGENSRSAEYPQSDSPQGTDSADGEKKQEILFSDFVITDILEEKVPYTIYVVRDRRAGARSIEMWGPLGESSFFLLRSPLEDIRRSAAVANRFNGFVGLAAAGIGAFIAWLLSRRIAEPIQELTDISVRMKDLDFSAKYAGGSRTELDTLGRNMNDLAQKLETTISALRTANNDLQRDLDRRNRQEEMRQEFLSNVTHELKTPIALVKGYAEGLQDGIADDPESRAFYLETIIEESDRMNTIVQKVLMLNQLEFGDETVSMERFDLASMIRNYLESASLLAQQAGADLLFAHKGSVYVWGDPFLIQEVFQNYYSNALHHVKPAAGSGTKEAVIDIRIEFRGQTVRVTVFNTGDPIPEASLPHIWEKFYKVDKARTRAYGGSGIGLSLVKAIMDLHHREYGAENYENGVAFWFELDLAGVESEKAAEERGKQERGIYGSNH
ncbi:MAG: HAMP domain-containing sensor histidine kinase [Eubacteriales bacterium]|nr:HAMP domain-containing sensor histidine kinase [Eubacteriales bacterium]